MQDVPVSRPGGQPAPSEAPFVEGSEAVHGTGAPPTAAETTQPPAEGGLPQFRTEYWGGQIVWLLVLFAILYVLMSRVFAPRIRRALDARDQTIQGAIDEARRVQAEADAQAEAGRKEVADARARSQRTAADAKAAAAAEGARRQAEEEERLNAQLSSAEASIASAREQAMTNVRAIAVDTASGIVERLTGRPADAAEVEAALPAARTA